VGDALGSNQQSLACEGSFMTALLFAGVQNYCTSPKLAAHLPYMSPFIYGSPRPPLFALSLGRLVERQQVQPLFLYHPVNSGRRALSLPVR
jgi:hypothetical protein